VTASPYLVGRGIADITGEAAECGMLGYGKADQRTEGIHLRLRSRAFVIVDSETERRVLLSINDLPMMFASVHRAVLAELRTRWNDVYTEHNVMIAATHTHCGPGGYSHHLLYNTTTLGFHVKTFDAIVAGIVEAATRAHDNLAPSELTLSHAELHDASVNRSRPAFDRNPAEDRAHFPDAIDPAMTSLGIVRQGTPVGAINWFATHNTSMTNHNRLISADNKGYAAYHWEREVHAVDYRSDDNPAFVAAFPQTNAGDMSPNLHLSPGSGPTQNEFDNTRINGLRQYNAARANAGDATPIEGPVDALMTYLDLGNVTVSPAFTGDGRAHRTTGPIAGASCLAGAWADGIAFPGFREGRNPLVDRLSAALFYRRSPELKDAQAPKGMVIPGNLLNRGGRMVQEQVPIQLIRIGQLYLIGIPGEVTIVAGLRLRRAAAKVLDADLENVLCAGYSNAYMHYVTTPEEFEEQRYEGGSTLFGRWELPALIQTVTALAEAMAGNGPVPTGPPPPDLTGRVWVHRDRATPDRGTAGEVISEPRRSYRAGDTAVAVFVGAHPNNRLRRGDTYLEIQRRDGDTWRTIADDGDWSTIFRWARDGRAGAGRGRSRITITWAIPPEAEAGFEYRIRYRGDARDEQGAVTEVTGSSRPFTIEV
jgi:neutral ceramidase